MGSSRWSGSRAVGGRCRPSFCFVFSVFLALSVAIGVHGDRQHDGDGRRGTGGGKYTSRAPGICPHRPDHCTSLQQAPWTCRPESDCSRKNFTIQSDSKFAKSDASINLTANTYYFNASNNKAVRCHRALNLTWTMNPNGVIGFFLRITLFGPSLGAFNRTRDLTFWIDERRLTPERENGLVTFFSDCVRLSVASTYQFDLFSIHAVPDSNETVSKFIGITSLVTDCETYPGKWDGFTNITFSESDSSVRVFFTPAPQSLGFQGYHVTVAKTGSNETLAGVYDLTFTCTNFDAVVIRNLCPGNYAVLVTAYGGHCSCTTNCSNCQLRSVFNVSGSKDDCRNDNVSAVVGLQPPVVVGETPSAVRIPAERTTSHAVRGVQKNNSAIVNGVVIVAFGVVVSMAIIAAAAHAKRRRKRLESPVVGATTVAADFEEENAVVEMDLDDKRRPNVLVIHANDNAYHCNAVRCLAAYLERRCGCRVTLADAEWRSDEIAGLPALDRLLVRMESTDSVVVVVNSEAGWRRYDGDSRNVAYQKIAGDDCTSSSSPGDACFLAAVRNLSTRRCYTQPTTNQRNDDGRPHHRPRPRQKLFTVAFPYTDPKYFVADDIIHPGGTYRLMEEIEGLLLGVHGLSKTGSGDGNATTAAAAVGISGSEYARCAEGRRLQVAIDEAVEYFRSSVDWFRSFYRQETTTTTTTTTTTVAFEDQTTTSSPTTFCDAPWSSASPEEWARLHSILDSGLGSSAEYMYLGTNFVPPSGGGSYNDDDDDDDDDDVSLSAAIVRMNNEYDEAFTWLE